MSVVANLLDSKGRDVFTIGPDRPVREAVEKMEARSVGTSVVVERDQLVGIVSERDVFRKVVLQGSLLEEVRVRDIMSSEVVTIDPETSLAECMRLMTEKRIRHLPVLSGGVLSGIVSIGDVVKYLVVEKDLKIRNLETYISGTM